MTLNIWNYNPPWPRRRELILDIVRKMDPDVIGFQEIRHDAQFDLNGKHQAEQLAEGLSAYSMTTVPAQEDEEEDRWEGLAIFSKFPVKSVGHEMLSRDKSDEADRHQRIVLHAALDLECGTVHLFNTHLSLSRNARERAAKEICQFADRTPLDAGQVLVGDLNDVPESPPIRYLLDSGFSDIWDRLHRGEAGETYSDENCYVQESGRRRIDYTLARLEPDIMQPVSCERVGVAPSADGHMPSDHFGLVTDLNWNEK